MGSTTSLQETIEITWKGNKEVCILSLNDKDTQRIKKSIKYFKYWTMNPKNVI